MNLYTHTWIFFPLVNSVSWWQAEFEWGSVLCSRGIFIVRKIMERLGQRTRFRVFFSDISWYQDSKELDEPQESGFSPKNLNQVRCSSNFVIFLTMEIRREHYLTQMLLAINWLYWQAGRNSRMRMKVEGRLIQVRFLEIHQVFAEKSRMLF